MQHAPSTSSGVSCQVFPATADQVPAARRFLATILDGCAFTGDAVLCLSEIVTNALFPLRVEGLQDLPARGPYILVANHVSWYDPFAIEFALGERIRFMATGKNFEVAGLGKFTPTRKEVQATTVVVIITGFLFGADFGVIDYVIGQSGDKLMRALSDS